MHIQDLQSNVVKIDLDYFYVNEVPVSIPNVNGQFSSGVVTLPNPGVFCVGQGQTVDMFSNITINQRGAGNATLQVLKNGSVVVATASFYDLDNAEVNNTENFLANGSVYYRETVPEVGGATFEFTIELQNTD